MTLVQFDVPNTVITNSMISGTDPITASKLYRHQSLDVQLFSSTTSVTSVVTDLHICRATGILVAIEASINGTIATGADRTITIDLHKSTGAAAFATVLSSTIGFTNASVLRTPVVGVISNTSLVDNDMLRLVTVVAGAAGAQALGLIVTLTYAEKYS